MTAAPDTFSLRNLIREVAEESALADPGALAKEVSKHVTDDLLRACFDEMIRPFVQNVISGHRFASAPPTPADDSAEIKEPDGGKSKSNRSWKVKGVRETWRSILRQRLHVGPGSSDWQFLGEATTEELRFAAGERRDLAAANVANAAKLEALAALCDEHGVDAPARLADDVLAEFFGRSW
ncbi:hypothetical protein [Acrocarpospora sp. B8E8]|uniref:hypothetical protein n=1 Tax=Acrocarpospora sp. B8E8 TaxID=3153572 RepID=UPI00325CECD6